MIEQEKYFWEEHVLPRSEPPYTESGDLVLESIRLHHGLGDPKVPAVILNKGYAVSIEKYLSLRTEKLDLENKAKQLDNTMKTLYAPIADEMGDVCTATCQSGKDNYLISFNPVSRNGINKDGLEKLKLHHPDIYDEYVQASVSRRFSIKKGAAS